MCGKGQNLCIFRFFSSQVKAGSLNMCEDIMTMNHEIKHEEPLKHKHKWVAYFKDALKSQLLKRHTTKRPKLKLPGNRDLIIVAQNTKRK